MIKNLLTHTLFIPIIILISILCIVVIIFETRNEKEVSKEVVIEKVVQENEISEDVVGETVATDDDTLRQEVQEMCPDETRMVFGKCLSDFAEKKQADATDAYSGLVKKISAVVERNSSKDQLFTIPRAEEYLEAMNAYHDKWASYVETKCDLLTVHYGSGNGRGDALSGCKIKEAQVYLQQLKEIEHDQAFYLAP